VNFFPSSFADLLTWYWLKNMFNNIVYAYHANEFSIVYHRNVGLNPSKVGFAEDVNIASVKVKTIKRRTDKL